MSYRSVKRLLGETSLERKCRFLFGGGLLVLIGGSFYFYAHLTSKTLFEQNRTTARLLIPPILLEKHWRELESNADFKKVIPVLAGSLKPDDLRDYSWTLTKPDYISAQPNERPRDQEGYDAQTLLANGESEVEFTSRTENSAEYRYYGAVTAAPSCISKGCHNDHKAGDFLGVAKISLPLTKTDKARAYQNAVLLAMAIVTAFLAMLAAYAIVRYVIVKPVLHLKQVSDAITRGNLDQRADIRTGDEFEELSHAFNRMLRHLVTVQDELRQVNTDLDVKVDELAQVNLRLYEMNKLKGEFLATMSHELRTPLNSVLGFSEILFRARNLTRKQKRFLQNIQTSGQNLLTLINDILDLAKIEGGKMELHIAECCIPDLVDRLVASMLPFAESKNIDLRQEIDRQMPLLLQDAGKLDQILNNLLSNAIKFTPEGGRVRVAAHLRDESTLELVVEDTGIGIPLEEQETIFEKFRQGRTASGAENALTREFGGTGLGLSIVKELAKLLGGEVLLVSEFGKGSTFTIRVPAKIQAHPKPRDEVLMPGTLALPAPGHIYTGPRSVVAAGTLDQGNGD